MKRSVEPNRPSTYMYVCNATYIYCTLIQHDQSDRNITETTTFHLPNNIRWSSHIISTLHFCVQWCLRSQVYTGAVGTELFRWKHQLKVVFQQKRGGEEYCTTFHLPNNVRWNNHIAFLRAGKCGSQVYTGIMERNVRSCSKAKFQYCRKGLKWPRWPRNCGRNSIYASMVPAVGSTVLHSIS